jgi:hypothetical protein
LRLLKGLLLLDPRLLEEDLEAEQDGDRKRDGEEEVSLLFHVAGEKRAPA